MTVLLPVYRATVMSPRSVDPTETTPLAPAASAPHTDNFKVISKMGVTGWQPYLDVIKGRRGQIDPRERKTDTGTMSVRLMDKRIAENNFDRWVTGFVGDANGIYNLMGLKIVIEESLDDGAAWAYFYTGRITDASLDGKVAIILQLRDMGEDLNQDIFIGSPHSSVTYANRAPILPRGILFPYGTLPIEKPLNATVFGGPPTVRTLQFKNDGPWQLRAVTPTWEDNHNTEGAMIACVKQAGVEHWYACIPSVNHFQPHGAEQQRSNQDLVIDLLPADHVLYYGTPPTPGASVTVYVLPTDKMPISPAVPLLLNDAHPIQFWKDILDGKYGPLTPAGVVRWPVAYDAAAFATLIADTSFPGIRLEITEKAKMNAFIEDVICKPMCLAYRLDEQGRVVPIDLRRKSATGVVSTISDADLVAGGKIDWTQSRNDAITFMTALYYVETQTPLETAAVQMNTVRLSEKSLVQGKWDPAERTLDVGQGSVLELDCKCLRYMTDERMPDGSYRLDFIKRYLDGLIADYRGPFSGGAQYMNLRTRRTANTNVAKPGTYHAIDVDAIPDPSTNRRGGVRLALCIDRHEDGPAIDLGFIDLGENAAAAIPSLGTLIANAIDPLHAIDVPLTLNAAGEPAQIMVAVTETSVGTRPVVDSALWQATETFLIGGTKTVPRLPGGQRIWVRARTLPYGNSVHGLRQPSDWVFPATGFVDLTAEQSITGLTVTGITQSTADVAWVVGDASLEVEILLTLGTAPATWLDSQIVNVLSPGSTAIRLRQLDGPSVQHTVGVRHQSLVQGFGPVTTATFTTTSTPRVAPRPAGIDCSS